MKPLLLPLLSAAAAIHAADPPLSHWTTPDGGGGHSAGGPFAVTGTLDQFNAVSSHSGGCAVQGGFRIPSAPRLKISPCD